MSPWDNDPSSPFPFPLFSFHSSSSFLSPSFSSPPFFPASSVFSLAHHHHHRRRRRRRRRGTCAPSPLCFPTAQSRDCVSSSLPHLLSHPPPSLPCSFLSLHCAFLGAIGPNATRLCQVRSIDRSRLFLFLFIVLKLLFVPACLL